MNKKYQVVISCGGFGTRLENICKGVPKPLFPILGKSTLERSIEQLSNYSFDNILITVSYKKELFKDIVDLLSHRYKLNIDIFEEKTPLGECGAFCF